MPGAGITFDCWYRNFAITAGARFRLGHEVDHRTHSVVGASIGVRRLASAFLGAGMSALHVSLAPISGARVELTTFGRSSYTRYELETTKNEFTLATLQAGLMF